MSRRQVLARIARRRKLRGVELCERQGHLFIQGEVRCATCNYEWSCLTDGHDTGSQAEMGKCSFCGAKP